jgi:hypothetical protein
MAPRFSQLADQVEQETIRKIEPMISRLWAAPRNSVELGSLKNGIEGSPHVVDAFPGDMLLFAT